MVVSFNDKIDVLCDLTNDRSKLERAIRRAHTGDGTRLYDAVDMVINKELSRIQGRKAIVLFTDGVDTTSRRASYESTVMDAQELDALIYPVQYDTSRDVANQGPFPNTPDDIFGQILGGIFGGGRRGGRRGGGGYPGGGYPRGGGGYPGGRGGSRNDYELANRYLHELADNTGGRDYQADTLQNMASAFGNVAEELRRQYSIGYYPKNAGQPGQRRQITVRANQPNLAVRARDSYIFNPSGGTVADGNQSPPVLKKLSETQHNSTRF
jgi:VWFA-related protein